MSPEDVRIGRSLKALRLRKRLRQIDVAAIAGVSQSLVSRAERGLISGISVGVLRSLFAAVGGRLEMNASWNGAALDRLLDSRHAALVEAVTKRLTGRGWLVVAEVSFSHFGERGAFDLLAWHPATRSLLVVEVKTELGALEATLRTLDMKVRLAARIARDRFGWIPATTSRVIVFPEDRTVRRQLERHETTIASVLPLTSQAIRTWISKPVATIGGIWFMSDPTSETASPRRVRVAS